MVSREKYVERLFNEWKKHGKIIIAVDYDDSLSPWKLTENKEDLLPVWELIKQAKFTGAYIVIFTACDTSRYPEIQKYCDEMGVSLDTINENPIDLPYGKYKKIYANIFLDDRAGLNEAMSILEEAMYRYRGYLKSKESLDEIA